ncbi:MAG: hypothetical protein LBL32_03390 [Holosporales bacterium]|jgi:hypothetical protein|nr:hypothetical protein [Holosporales bacterium]
MKLPKKIWWLLLFTAIIWQYLPVSVNQKAPFRAPKTQLDNRRYLAGEAERKLSKKEFLAKRILKIQQKTSNTPCIDPPTTYNEMLLFVYVEHDRLSPLTSIITNRILVRQFIAHIIGEQHLPKLFCVADDITQVDFSKLPNLFVIKTVNGGYGGIQVDIVDKRRMNLDAIYEKYSQAKPSPFGVPGKIIVEERLPPAPGYASVIDYKFLCFRGKAYLVRVTVNFKQTVDYRTKNAALFTLPDFQRLPVMYDGKPLFANKKPDKLNEMIKIAERLASYFPLIRIDMYLIGDRILIGEITPFSSGGWAKFEPAAWDAMIGAMLYPPLTRSELALWVERDRWLVYNLLSQGVISIQTSSSASRPHP